MKISSKKVFKEKTSIKKELEKALLNQTPVSISILAKLVGISTYRVKKYCERHQIDLKDYDVSSLKNKPIIDTVQKKSTKKLKIGLPKPVKIQIGSPLPINLKN